MNIYDFDNTIYNGDTNADLIKYSFLRHPFSVISSLIRSFFLYKEYRKGHIPFGDVKVVMLSFLFKIEDVDKYLDKFVDKNIHKIKKWYLESKKDDDIIISASYEIWVKKFCDKIGIKNVIATKTDEKGNIVGKNCKGKEKIIRLENEFPNIKVKHAYSDSKADIPMLEYALTSYVVEGENLVEYKKGYVFKK